LNVRLPLTVSVLGAPIAPGSSVPPLATFTLPTDPLPVSVPPLATVVALVMEPSTWSVPPRIEVAPV
jgi:hypothetical protein